MENKKFIVELVIKEPPYICVGYVNKTSLAKNTLEYAKHEKDALIVEDKNTMDKVLYLISENNKDPKKAYIMDWITQIGNKKRIFAKNIVW